MASHPASFHSPSDPFKGNVMNGATKTCNVCGKDRPKDDLAVFQTDVSERLGCLPGSFTQNVYCCKDNPDCASGAPKVNFLGPQS